MSSWGMSDYLDKMAPTTDVLKLRDPNSLDHKIYCAMSEERDIFLSVESYCFHRKLKTQEYVKLYIAFTTRKHYFLREKIICLQKLLEIPESWDEVYYARKSEFMALLKKI